MHSLYRKRYNFYKASYKNKKTLYNGNCCLRLRSLKASAEFDDYWKYYLRQESINNYENAVEDLEGLMKKIEKQVVSK